MRPPVPISTLPDAARWMSELSGATMTERELLGHAFNFQQADQRVERIIQVIIPVDAEMRLRYWRRDGYTERATTRAERVVALDSYELFDLLTYDCAEITLPRLTDPYEGDEHAELILDGAVVTHSMTRIYARGLYILAAWWQSTVGAAGLRMSTPPAMPPVGMGLGVPELRAPRKHPAGGDALTATIWSICYDLVDAWQRQTPGPVMAELKARADDPDPRRKGPLLSSVAGGVKYEDSNGAERELNVAQLQARISEWRKAVARG